MASAVRMRVIALLVSATLSVVYSMDNDRFVDFDATDFEKSLSRIGDLDLSDLTEDPASLNRDPFSSSDISLPRGNGRPTGPQRRKPDSRGKPDARDQPRARPRPGTAGPQHPLRLPAPTNSGADADLSRCSLARAPRTCDKAYPYRSMDGSCNNLRRPTLGQAERLHARLISPHLDGGPGGMRTLSVLGTELPSARTVTTKVFEVAQDGDLSKRFSNTIWVWGQFIDHDLTFTPQVSQRECCGRTSDRQCIPISVQVDDPAWGATGRTCISVKRSKAVEQGQCGQGHREQINELTSYIDASMVYGSSERRSNELRSGRGGKMRSSGNSVLPIDKPGTDCELPTVGHPDRNCFAAGESRPSENMGITSIHVVFMREHNRIADILYNKYRAEYSGERELDERVFQETRRIVIALIQSITYQEYLPLILGRKVMNDLDLMLRSNGGGGSNYRPDVDATVVNGFATAAYRFGHSQISDGFQPLDHNYSPVRSFIDLVDTFNQPMTYRQAGHEPTVRAVIKAPAQRAVDQRFSGDLRDKLFEKAQGKNKGFDLPALNIQRGRDHGLPAYNKWRQLCGLSEIRSFSSQLADHSPEISRRLSQVYQHPDDIDLYPGGVTERPVSSDALVGPTFACLIGDQFWRLKHGDRFWFENRDSYQSPFTDDQISQIKRVTLAKVICDNMHTSQRVYVPSDAFKVNSQQKTCDQLYGIDYTQW